MKKLNIVVAVTGASGAVYAQMLLDSISKLSEQTAASDLIFSDCARKVWAYELGQDDFSKLPFRIFEPDDYFAPPASGSAGYDVMIICPCTMGTLGRIASGISDSLITRAADVMLKERKKLIIVTREMPLSLIHINNMKILTEAGAIICPASPSFYTKAQKTEEILQTVIDKVLNLAGFTFDFPRWGKSV